MPKRYTQAYLSSITQDNVTMAIQHLTSKIQSDTAELVRIQDELTASTEMLDDLTQEDQARKVGP